MAAMKPRTGDGPMEVTKEARSLVMRIPVSYTHLTLPTIYSV